ncbi:hypothetical protein G7K_6750-t1 [Saitoella complicata NRRL Y-17804]|uniref:Uncharacterized protein n=1 Tax=Saitoella complicata (strain BCRC 22490 / CBS 7301 / JCM 7358 / NBRC 10748 / NRRL Y-17804) TaxID=698492 RepID=A0A0E9NS27_SAICN|nr:hypothetical protein G7K_6750-t1 [Saitoella complicata NRRL Y-17804]
MGQVTYHAYAGVNLRRPTTVRGREALMGAFLLESLDNPVNGSYRSVDDLTELVNIIALDVVLDNYGPCAIVAYLTEHFEPFATFLGLQWSSDTGLNSGLLQRPLQGLCSSGIPVIAPRDPSSSTGVVHPQQHRQQHPGDALGSQLRGRADKHLWPYTVLLCASFLTARCLPPICAGIVSRTPHLHR